MLSLLLLAVLADPARALSAAAAKVDITPDIERRRIYMAGYGAKGKRPHGVHDPLHARLLVVSDGHRTIGIVGLDLLGYTRNDVEDLRRLAGFTGPDRYLFVAATHQHSGPDTLGLWGPLPGLSGVNARYHREIKDRIAAALRDLSGKLEPAALEASVRRIDPSGICKDLRDPKVIDPDLGVARFVAKGGKTLATVVNYSCHPEVLGKKNRMITADFPGPLCDDVEEALGGTCVYLSGSIGGLLSPDHKEGREDFFEAHRIGAALAAKAAAQARGPAARYDPPASAQKPSIDVKSETVLVPVENSRYLAFLPALTFGHDLKEASGRRIPGWKAYWLALKHILVRLSPGQRPWVETEVSLVTIGPLRILGIPAEIFPELVIGGYDGRYRGKWPLLDPKNPDPPDLSKAPKGPYLKELMGRGPLDGVPFVVGLANDEIGYLVPDYDFKIRGNLTLLPRMPGHHYEETNSIGPKATEIVLGAARRLLQAERSSANR